MIKTQKYRLINPALQPNIIKIEPKKPTASPKHPSRKMPNSCYCCLSCQVMAPNTFPFVGHRPQLPRAPSCHLQWHSEQNRL